MLLLASSSGLHLLVGNLVLVDAVQPGLDLRGILGVSQGDEGAETLEVLLLLGILGSGRRLLGLSLEDDNAGRSLGGGSNAELSAGFDKQVGDRMLLAEEGEAHDDLHRGHIRSQDDNALGSVLSADVERAGRGFLDHLVAFFHPTMNHLHLGT